MEANVVNIASAVGGTDDIRSQKQSQMRNTQKDQGALEGGETKWKNHKVYQELCCIGAVL
jgi:hypothetical protein